MRSARSSSWAMNAIVEIVLASQAPRALPPERQTLRIRRSGTAGPPAQQSAEPAVCGQLVRSVSARILGRCPARPRCEQIAESVRAFRCGNEVLSRRRLSTGGTVRREKSCARHPPRGGGSLHGARSSSRECSLAYDDDEPVRGVQGRVGPTHVECGLGRMARHPCSSHPPQASARHASGVWWHPGMRLALRIVGRRARSRSAVGGWDRIASSGERYVRMAVLRA
jgi:hypothetical protein